MSAIAVPDITELLKQINTDCRLILNQLHIYWWFNKHEITVILEQILHNIKTIQLSINSDTMNYNYDYDRICDNIHNDIQHANQNYDISVDIINDNDNDNDNDNTITYKISGSSRVKLL